MSNTKFTPGPWNDVNEGWAKHSILEADGGFVAEIELGAENLEANKSLIASAPELYEALELILSDEDYSGSVDALLLAHSALAKARDES